ncbi:hypothetical protein ACLMJK_003695 [Lecanora helva]
MARPPRPQGRIPNVKTLCAELGFSNDFDSKFDRHFSVLKEATQMWRKQYKSKIELPVKDLCKWKDPQTQDELENIARSFLFQGDYGKEFWPTTTPDDSRLQCQRDKFRIIDLLKQLFWSQNMNEQHNAKYPDRSRKKQDGVDSDHSPTTLMASIDPENDLPSVAQLVDQSSSRTRSTLDPIPKKSSLFMPPAKKHQPGTQLSGSCYIPSSCDTVDTGAITEPSASKPESNPGDPANHDNDEDIYDFAIADADEPRPQKIKAMKRINESFRQALDLVERDNSSKQPDNVTSKGSTSSKLPVTPETKRTTYPLTPKTSSGSSASFNRTDGQLTTRKRKDIDDDDQDEDYIPKKRNTNKQKPSPGKSSFLSTSDSREVMPRSAGQGSTPRRPSDQSPRSPQSNPKDRPSIRTYFQPASANEPQPARVPSHTHHVEDDIFEGADLYGASEPTTPSRLVAGSSPAPADPVPEPVSEPVVSAPVNKPVLEPAPNPEQAEAFQATVAATSLEPEVQPAVTAPQDELNQPNELAESPHPPISKPPITIRHSIIAARHPRLTRIRLPGYSLTRKTLPNLLSDISTMTSKRDIQRIEFKLTSSWSDSRMTVGRSQSAFYEEMKTEFAKDIRSDVRKGEVEFEFWMEPDPPGDGIVVDEGDLQVGRGGEDEKFAFEI